MKKKPRDFQKVKLKVGKRLPKGRNETKTSFQTKKINLKEQVKETVKEPTLKELLSFMKSADVQIKFDNLRKLFKYVSNNKETLSMYFPDILKELGRTLQESDPKIRSETISLLCLCAENLTDTQLKSFIAPVTLYLNCMMTHMSLRVRQDSLKLLDGLLNSHCFVICESYDILFYLLNMISFKSNSGGDVNKNKDKRILLEIISSKISVDEWRMEVLKRMLTFLNGISIKKDSMAIDTDDKKKIYWDAKEALYLPLYLNSGVKPEKFDYSLYCSVNAEGCDSENFITFVSDCICILSAILRSITIRKCNTESVTNYLSIITQILGCLAEWAAEYPDLDEDLNIVKGLAHNCCLLLKKFPYEELPCKVDVEEDIRVEFKNERINLEICYLYYVCHSLNEKSIEKSSSVQNYVLRTFKRNSDGGNPNEKSLSLFLKMGRMLKQCKGTEDVKFMQGMVLCMYEVLDLQKLTPMINNIYSFFMDLSQDYEHMDLESGVLQKWFYKLIDYLSFMIESKSYVPNYLNYLRQICARRIAVFMGIINNLQPEKLINYLKCDDEDCQLTIIHFIVSLDNMSPDLWQDLAETVRMPSFPLKTACRLIRLLHNKFSQPDVSNHNQMHFLKFLLNVGCDTFLIWDPSLDIDPLPLTDMLISFQRSFACPCEIYPTPDFERHHEIFKVCKDCLPPYLQNDFHSNCVMHFIRTIFSDNERYPVHSMVAIIELFKRFSILVNDDDAVGFLQNFVFSCLLYNSLITKDVPKEHWNEYCVVAVQDCLDVVNALSIIDLMDNNIHNATEDHLSHIFRILKFLMERGLFDEVDKNSIFVFLNKLSKLDAFHTQPEFEIMLHHMYDYLTRVDAMC